MSQPGRVAPGLAVFYIVKGVAVLDDPLADEETVSTHVAGEAGR